MLYLLSRLGIYLCLLEINVGKYWILESFTVYFLSNIIQSIASVNLQEYVVIEMSRMNGCISVA